jgi:hypothetical protein
MSDRRIVTARRPVAPVDLNAQISTLPEIGQKRHLAYTQLLGLEYLVGLYGSEELAKAKRDHTRRYLYTFVNKLIEEELFNGTIREFLDILKERLREKIAAGMSASPPTTTRATRPARPARPAPQRNAPLPPPPRISPPRVTGNRRERSPRNTPPSSTSTKTSSSHSHRSQHSNEEEIVMRNPRINQLNLSLGNMNIIEDEHPHRHRRHRRRVQPPVSLQPTQRQLDLVARERAAAQARSEERQRLEAARIAARQHRQEAPQRRQAVEHINELLRNL